MRTQDATPTSSSRPDGAGAVLRDAPGGTLVKVRAAPGASRERLALHGDALKAAVQAPPEKGKANEAIARLLARSLGLRRSQVTLHSGGTGRDKWFLIAGLGRSTVQALLERLAP